MAKAKVHYDVSFTDRGFLVTELDAPEDKSEVCVCPGIGRVQEVVKALEASIRLKELRDLGF